MSPDSTDRRQIALEVTGVGEGLTFE